MEMINVKKDWNWIFNNAREEMMDDCQLHKDVLRVAKEQKLDIVRIVTLYSAGIYQAENGKYLSFKDWFYDFFQAKMVNIKNDWNRIFLHVREMMMNDCQLNKDVLKVAKQQKLDIVKIVLLYSAGIYETENGNRLSFKNWFYEFYQL